MQDTLQHRQADAIMPCQSNLGLLGLDPRGEPVTDQRRPELLLRLGGDAHHRAGQLLAGAREQEAAARRGRGDAELGQQPQRAAHRRAGDRHPARQLLLPHAQAGRPALRHGRVDDPLRQLGMARMDVVGGRFRPGGALWHGQLVHSM
jgi:hypothetical protein